VLAEPFGDLGLRRGGTAGACQCEDAGRQAAQAGALAAGPGTTIPSRGWAATPSWSRSELSELKVPEKSAGGADPAVAGQDRAARWAAAQAQFDQIFAPRPKRPSSQGLRQQAPDAGQQSETAQRDHPLSQTDRPQTPGPAASVSLTVPRRAPAAEQSQGSPAAQTIANRVFHARYLSLGQLEALIEPLLTEGVGAVLPGQPGGSASGTERPAAASQPRAIAVRDYPAVLERIGRVVTELDVPPDRIALEALVLHVPLAQEDQQIRFELLAKQGNVSLGRQAACPAAAGASPESKTRPACLKLAVLESTVSALIDTLGQTGRVETVGLRSLSVPEGQAAEIPVGRVLGPADAAEGRPGSEVVRPEAVRLRPIGSADGSICLEIEAARSRSAVLEDGPPAKGDSSVVASRAIVQDGTALVLGGIVGHRVSVQPGKDSGCARLGLVGRAFNTSRVVAEPYEALVLISFRIVRAGSTQEAPSPAANLGADQDLPGGEKALDRDARSSLAACYYQAAQMALAGGNRSRALWLAEVALCFDPVNQAAIDWRNRIWLAGSGSGEPSPVRVAGRSL
ncbi:MAG: hypothetical protein ACUVUC_16645, partial [Thermoguttaceae bacterium]